MNKLILSVGNSSIVSHGAGFLGRQIKQADFFEIGSKIENTSNEDVTNIRCFSLEYNDKYDELFTLKEICNKLEDNKLYEFNYHNYLNVIVITEYKKRNI